MAKLVIEAVEALKESLSSPTGSPQTPSNKSPGSKTKFSLRKSFQKRGSKMTLFSRSNKDLSGVLSATQQQQVSAYTDEMIRLETVILSPKGRQLLIQDMLALPGDVAVKVRFIAAIDTWDDADAKEERARLAQKIVDTFVYKGSMFAISTLKPERVQALVTNGEFDQLFFARKDVLEELSKHEAVMQIVGNVEAIDGV